MIRLVLPTYNAGLFFSHGMQYISSSLAEQNIEHDIYMIRDDKDSLSKIAYELTDGDPKIIAFTATSFEFGFINKVAAEVKKLSNACLVLGGIHAIIDKESIKGSAFDYYCICEGEIVFPRFCKQLLKKGWPEQFNGFISKGETDCKLPVFVPEDINRELPLYREGKLPLQDILDERDGWLSISVSRGCPYKCTFCINHLLKRYYGGSKFCRRMSPEKAIAHLMLLLWDLEGIECINFDDDNLFSDIDWMNRFLTLYDYIHIPFIMNARASSIDEEVVDNLFSSGCHELQMAVESGDEFIRNTILGKGISNRQLINAYGICKKAKLRTLAYVMHGIPFSDKEHTDSTAELILQLEPTLVRDTYCYPFKNSIIRNMCDEAGIEIKDCGSNYFNEPVIAGHEGEKERFRQLISSKYKVCDRNSNYMELKW